MGATGTVIKLLVFEIIAIFTAHYAVKLLFGFDFFDFRSRTGQMVGIGLTVVVMYSIYSAVGSGELAGIGATALYNPTDRRRYEATQSMQPMLMGLTRS